MFRSFNGSKYMPSIGITNEIENNEKITDTKLNKVLKIISLE